MKNVLDYSWPSNQREVIKNKISSPTISEFRLLTALEIIEEVKKLQNVAYQLGLEEAKEMTRGKYLHILNNKKPKWLQTYPTCWRVGVCHVALLWPKHLQVM